MFRSSQTRLVTTTLFLGFWTGNTISHFRQGDYMAVYAGLGLSYLFTSESRFLYVCMTGASGAVLSFSVTWAFVSVL